MSEQNDFNRLFASSEDGIERDYDREIIFSEPHTDADVYQRLVKDINTTTYPDGRVEIAQYLSIERMRPQVGGGHYVRERTSLEIPTSRSGRAQLVTTFAAVLGLDVRVD